jgi:hypothetical protein
MNRPTSPDQFRSTLPTAQQRTDALVPRLDAVRASLRAKVSTELIEKSGCQVDAAGNYCLDFMGRAYVIDRSEFEVRRADTNEAAPAFIQSILLTYLDTADGTPPSERWISFRELPDGLFYASAFQGYTGDALLRDVRGSLGTFQHAAEAVQGEVLAVGDAGHAFRVLPRLRLAVVMWQGDEDFGPQLHVLFEDTAAHYMPTEGLAILGNLLAGQIAKAAD